MELALLPAGVNLRLGPFFRPFLPLLVPRRQLAEPLVDRGAHHSHKLPGLKMCVY